MAPDVAHSQSRRSAPTSGRPRRPTAPHDKQLPSGRHGLSRRYVAGNQRRRILDALVEVVATYGCQAATVERVAARAGVSRRTFYEQFADRERAYVALYDGAARALRARVELAVADAPERCAAGRLRAGLGALLEGLASAPELAFVCVVGVLSAGPGAIERRDAQMGAFAALLDDVARACGGAPLPPLTAEGIVGAVHDVVYKRVAAGEAAALPGLLDDLHRFCLMLFGDATDPRDA